MIHCYKTECKFCEKCICSKETIYLNDAGQDDADDQLLVCDSFEADED